MARIQEQTRKKKTQGRKPLRRTPRKRLQKRLRRFQTSEHDDDYEWTSYEYYDGPDEQYGDHCLDYD